MTAEALPVPIAGFAGVRLVEPMTAPTDALVSRRHLTVAPPGGRFEVAFRVNVR